MQFLPAGATGQTSNSHCDHEIRSTWGSIRKHGLRDNQEIVNWAAESEALIGMIGVYFMLIFSGIWKLYIHEKTGVYVHSMYNMLHIPNKQQQILLHGGNDCKVLGLKMLCFRQIETTNYAYMAYLPSPYQLQQTFYRPKHVEYHSNMCCRFSMVIVGLPMNMGRFFIKHSGVYS